VMLAVTLDCRGDALATNTFDPTNTPSRTASCHPSLKAPTLFMRTSATTSTSTTAKQPSNVSRKQLLI